MWPFAIAAGVILAVAGALIAWHVRTWRAALAARLSAADLKFAFEIGGGCRRARCWRSWGV
jgi:hypothetical protein